MHVMVATDGSLDASFGTGGLVVTDLGGAVFVSDVAVDDAGLPGLDRVDDQRSVLVAGSDVDRCVGALELHSLSLPVIDLELAAHEVLVEGDTEALFVQVLQEEEWARTRTETGLPSRCP